MTALYHEGHRSSHHYDEFRKMLKGVQDGIPTFDRRLDSFFNQNAYLIIEKWGLVTDDDLSHLKNKLDYLSYEVGRLIIEQKNLEIRTSALKLAIEDLEKK